MDLWRLVVHASLRIGSTHMVLDYRYIWVLALLLSSSPALGGDLLRWVDDAGVTHFARSLEAVPQKYRDQVKPEKVRTDNMPNAVLEQRSGSSPRSPNAGATFGKQPALSVHEVPFEAYEGDAQRVIVSVTFNGSVTVPMLIDTGAPGVIISPKVAKRLGLLDNGEGMVLSVAGGIGGKVPAVRTFLDTVQVGAAKDTFIPATITESISESFEGLIGMVFMSKYSFKIDSVKKMVILEEVQPNAQDPAGRNERWWRSQFKELRALHDAWEEYSLRNDLDDQARAFARSQVYEAQKLLSKLDRQASLYSVPHPWR